METEKPFAICREHPGTETARALIAELDAYLDPLYSAESQHGYDVEKLIAQGVKFFVLYEEGEPAACGGVQLYGEPSGADYSYGEIKRMYVRPGFRGRGYAKKMLEHLEGVAAAKGYAKVRLEVGVSQPEALGLYERTGYHKIPPFGEYWDDPLSLFYEKGLGELNAPVASLLVDSSYTTLGSPSP